MSSVRFLSNDQENVQPRHLSHKSPPIAPHTKKTCDSKQEQARKFENEIADVSEIEPWLRYIKWVKSTYQEGDEIKTILGRCARHFSSDQRYTDDLRYLEISSCTDTADEMFQNLEKKGIGLGHALFYEAWATIKEKVSKYGDAQAIYQRGINRGHVSPMDRLKRHFGEFMYRMQVRLAKVNEETSEEEPPPAPNPVEQPKAIERDADGRRPGEVPAYDTSLIFADGNELQFEEVRANHRPFVPDDRDSDMDVSMEVTEYVKAPSRTLGFITPPLHTPSPAALENSRVALFSDTPEPTMYASPTIKTKLALDDVLSMFSGSIEFNDATTTIAGTTIMSMLKQESKPSFAVFQDDEPESDEYMVKPALFDQNEQDVLLSKIDVEGVDEHRPPYTLGSLVGDGGYAKVYKTELNSCTHVVKVQSPPCVWEYYIIQQLKQRVREDMTSCFVNAHSLHVHRGKSYILMDYTPNESLQVAINAHRLTASSMDESLVLFFAAEAMRVVEELHACYILSCDIKPDNFLIRYSRPIDRWTPSRHGSWKKSGLQLIDYGCSIDCSLYDEGTLFKGTSESGSFKCPAMERGDAWGSNQDLYGIGSTLYFLLFGEYMTTETMNNGRIRPKGQLRRYWQKDLWTTVFDTLLNAEPELIGPEHSERSTLHKLRLEVEDKLAKFESKLRDQLPRMMILMSESEASK